MRFYLTSYTLFCDDANKHLDYTGKIYAKNEKHAELLAKKRNIGESVLGEMEENPEVSPLPSEFYKKRHLMACIHVLTFYSWVASKAKIINLGDMCSDVGLLHEVIHESHLHQQFSFRETVYSKLIKFESQIPGLKLA